MPGLGGVYTKMSIVTFLKNHRAVTFGKGLILRYLQIFASQHFGYGLNLNVFCFTPFVLSFFSLDRVAWPQLLTFPFFFRFTRAGVLEAFRGSVESTISPDCLGIRMSPLLATRGPPALQGKSQRRSPLLFFDFFFFSSVLMSRVCF